MNSNSLLTTVLRNLQWARKNRGYWPTMYIMLEAIIALLSLPFFCSHMPRSSLMTVTRKRFSSSSCMEPEIDPMAAECVEIFPRPIITIDLVLKLFCHDSLSIDVIKMGQINQSLTHVFVHVNGICILYELSNNFTLIILYNENLFRLSHSGNHDVSDLSQNR